jgi:hypothetical protein
MEEPDIRRRVLWKITLPTIMLVVTLVLLRLDKLCLLKARGVDDMPVSTAWGFICLLNWPAFFLTFWLRWVHAEFFGLDAWDWGRLVAAMSFWALIGWLLDRKLSGPVTPIIRKRWLRIGLCTLGLLIALFALFVGTLETIGHVRTWINFNELLRSKWVYLLGREINSLAAAMWGLIYTLYFGNKILGLRFKRSLTPA